MYRHVLMRAATLLALALLSATLLQAQDAATTASQPDPQAVADAIGKEVALIRGLSFKRPVGVESQSREGFADYVAQRIEAAVPAKVRSHYGKIVKTLGLYRGPELGDFSTMMRAVMTSQAGAYYDPQRQRFYMLMTKTPELLQGALYSHELYHALQDQHFGIVRYLNFNHQDSSINGDQLLARQSVVEGEATYMMTLWAVQKAMKGIPPRDVLAQVVGVQANMSMDQIRAMLQQPQMAQMMGEDVQQALRSADKIPAFIMDTMIGSYLKGMGFIFAVQEQGWPAVEKLYTEYPPQSMEQILHPEKWLAREGAVNFEWPDFGRVHELKSWELIDSDVLGEFRWRTVFKEHGLVHEADSAAAGWGGDRYAVFQRKGSDAMLLLLRTTWDSQADAAEFAEAYRRVLAIKYADGRTATRVVQDGVDVFIVEGAGEASMDSLLGVVTKARRRS